eukprot:1155418-Pelagomonas_calceolata.AAC.1
MLACADCQVVKHPCLMSAGGACMSSDAHSPGYLRVRWCLMHLHRWCMRKLAQVLHDLALDALNVLQENPDGQKELGLHTTALIPDVKDRMWLHMMGKLKDYLLAEK